MKMLLDPNTCIVTLLSSICSLISNVLEHLHLALLLIVNSYWTRHSP